MKAFILRLLGYIPVRVFNAYTKTWKTYGAMRSNKPFIPYEVVPHPLSDQKISIGLHQDGTCSKYIGSLRVMDGEYTKWWPCD